MDQYRRDRFRLRTALGHQLRYLATRGRFNDDAVDREVFARHGLTRSPIGPREIALIAREPLSRWDPRHAEVAHMDYRICDLCRLGTVLKIRTSEEWKRREYASWMLHRSRRFAPDYTWITSRQLSGSEAFWQHTKIETPGQYRAARPCGHILVSFRHPASGHGRAVARR